MERIMIDLNGKAAVITGSARGIGRAIAEKFIELGASVVISDINGEEAEKTAEELKSKGGKAISVPANVTNPEEASKLIESCVKEFGKIDILVNNAGITQDNLIIRMKKEQWDSVINVNLTGVFLCSQVAFKHMMKQKSGSIINISSISGERGNFGQTNYSATKAGIIGFTKSLALEGASRNIRCNAVAPGFIQTAMTDVLPDKVKDAIIEKVPLNRIGQPEDIANGIAYLASDAALYVTGIVLDINGGAHLA